MLAEFLGWLGQAGTAAALAEELADGSRVLLLKLARATRSGKPLDPSALADMTVTWDALAAELQRVGAAARVA